MSLAMVVLLLIIAVLIALVGFQLFTYRHLMHKLNRLNDYTQFLLFVPMIYRDHRGKFLDYLETCTIDDPIKLTHRSYEIIEDMSNKIASDIVLHNLAARMDPVGFEEARQQHEDSDL